MANYSMTDKTASRCQATLLFFLVLLGLLAVLSTIATSWVHANYQTSETVITNHITDL